MVPGAGRLAESIINLKASTYVSGINLPAQKKLKFRSKC